MKSPVKKLSIIISIILLPLLLYTYFEVTTLNENEQMLTDIYNQQIDDVALGVNQYSETVIKNWIREMRSVLSIKDIDTYDPKLVELIKNSKGLELIVFVDTNNINWTRFYSAFGKQNSPTAAKRIEEVIGYNRTKLTQLREFYTEGYDKIETLENNIDSTPILTTLIPEKSSQFNLILFAVDELKFIDLLREKKIIPLLRDEIEIEIIKKNEVVVEQLSVSTDSDRKHYDLWFFPNYSLDISFSGSTIAEFVSERTSLNIMLILLLNLVVIAGLIYLFFNAKKESELSQMKTDFVANVSHEIRTPLSLISMFAETLELGRVVKEEKKQEYYSIIRQESERLGNIVNKILNFSQMEANKKKLNFVSININDLLNEIMDTYQFHLVDKGVEYELLLTENLPWVSVDRETVSEAIINIIDNAVKYSKENPKIIIKTFKIDGFINVEFIDNGIGIAKENLNKIFDKFFRSSSTLVHDTKGNGLGLTLVKYIMNVHKGDVTVESKLGKGSTFKLEFPIGV